MKTANSWFDRSPSGHLWLMLAAVIGATTLPCGDDDETDIVTPPVAAAGSALAAQTLAVRRLSSSTRIAIFRERLGA